MSASNLDEKACSLIAEYLHKGNFVETLKVFRSECSEKGENANSFGSPVERSLIIGLELAAPALDQLDALLEPLDIGEREAFFSHWDAAVSPDTRTSDPVCRNLEFNSALYFAIYPYKHNLESKIDEAKLAFKVYLETRGASLAQTEEFVSFYALPYVPDPRQHPSFRKLFSDSWSVELRKKLVEFLRNLVKSSQTESKLVQICRNQGTRGEPCLSSKGVESMQHELTALRNNYTNTSRKLREVSKSYHSLVGVSTEMVTALETAVKEEMISADFLTKMCKKLFNDPSAFQSVELRPSTAASIMRASIGNPASTLMEEEEVPLLPSLDFTKIKQDLLMLSDDGRVRLLQALRWRLTKSLPGDQREAVIASYMKSDVFGFTSADNYTDSVLRMITSKSTAIAEQFARIINSLSSLKQGRVYIASSPKVISALFEQLKMQRYSDTDIQVNIIGALQKLSLRRQMQLEMIQNGLVAWLIEMLSGDHAELLSDYSFHYALALLMNLSLRSEGRQACVSHSTLLLKLLGDLMEHDSQEIRSYVNGILYSILNVPAIRTEAVAMGIGSMLDSAVLSSPPELVSQLKYIIEQLKGSAGAEEGVALKEELSEEEDSEEEDPDVIDGDDGEADPTGSGSTGSGPTGSGSTGSGPTGSGSTGSGPIGSGPIGEQLLMQHYLGVMASFDGFHGNVVQKLQGRPISRPVTPQSFTIKPQAHSIQADTQQPFVSRPMIPRTPVEQTQLHNSHLPPPPTPSDSPPTTINHRPPTRSGRPLSIK